jgi:hypothetical protein
MTEPDVIALEAVADLPPPVQIDDEALARVYRWGEGHPTLFAGVVASGQEVLVGLTEYSPEVLEELRSLLSGQVVRVFCADNSYADLRVTLHQISDDLHALRREGVRVFSVAVDERENRVVIQLDPKPEAVELLRRKYGSERLSFRPGGPRYAVSTRANPSQS